MAATAEGNPVNQKPEQHQQQRPIAKPEATATAAHAWVIAVSANKCAARGGAYCLLILMDTQQR
ncbi:hypothetical protein [uncultured Xanthomonas sp.]|uniref:hypothetical protein n=1 Tax=uncultured Xanthomonas sp. TaxID=152831 RepID=UPI003749AF55